MSELKKVSIIVPVYNVEKYIHKCLLSLKEQSYSNIEVLMVNDGTKDNSEEICKQFRNEDERFILLSKENGGLSSARNYGLEYATGDYICFVDSDDYVMPDFVKNFVEKIDDVDVVISKYTFDDREIGKVYVPYKSQALNKKYSGEEKTREITKRLMFDCLDGDFEIKDSIMPVWKNMYRRDFIEKERIRFKSEREVYMEDFLFNLEAYGKATSVKVIEDAEYVHINLKGTLSQSYRKNMFEMQITNYNCAVSVLNEIYGKTMAEEYNKKLPYIIAYSAFKVVQCGYKEALHNLKEIIQSDIYSEVVANYKKPIFSPAYINMIYGFLRRKMRRSIYFSVRVMYMLKSIYGIFRMKK